MSAPTAIKIIAENLTDQARALAPGEGRRREVEIDEGALRTWLDNFAALPALETEDADGRLYVTVPARRLVVRRAGGKLGAEDGDMFVAATVEEIVAQLLATAARSAKSANEETAPEAPQSASMQGRGRAQAVLLAGLLVIFAGSWWWTSRPETPDGVEWVGDAGERQKIISQAAGNYASDNERLNLDAASERLIANNEAGEETLRTTVRVGHRSSDVVLVTEAGVVLEIMGADKLRISGVDYKRTPAAR